MSRSDSNRVDSADLTCRTHMAKPRPLANERTEYGPSLVLSPAICIYFSEVCQVSLRSLCGLSEVYLRFVRSLCGLCAVYQRFI